MSEILKLEDNANSPLKKLSELLENLSSNLSKEKTEKALDDGNECINEIENIIEQISNIPQDNYSKNNLFIIKGDLKQKKEKFEKIQEKYILNKSNQLIDTHSYETQEEDIEVYGQNERDIDENKNENLSDSEHNNEIEEKDDKDEVFHVNKDVSELSEEYIHNDNCLFLIKRKISKCFRAICYKVNEVNPRNKYKLILIILIILLILCVVGLFFSIF